MARRLVLLVSLLSLMVTGVVVSPVGASTSARLAAARPIPRIIIDTDLSLWWDDATAVGMANVLQQQGKLQLLGVMSDIRNPVAVAAIDAIDTAYRHASIPVGAVSDSAANTAAHGYSDIVAATLPHAIRSSADVPNAVKLYRRLLAAQPDHSVTIVAIGGDTNLAGLLTSRPDAQSKLSGPALIRAKVTRLVIEDGLFPGGGPPFTNEKIDPAATATVVNGWPTPVAWVDGLIGIATRVGASLCTTVSPRNPMRVVYQAEFGCGPPKDGDWDGPTLLYAVRQIPQAFSNLGQGGTAVINAQGGLSWQTAAPGHPSEVYVHVGNQFTLNQRIDQLLGTK